MDYNTVYAHAMEYVHVITHKPGNTAQKQWVSVKWEPPGQGFTKLNVDEAVKEGRGPGGIGGVFEILQVTENWHTPKKFSKLRRWKQN